MADCQKTADPSGACIAAGDTCESNVALDYKDDCAKQNPPCTTSTITGQYQCYTKNVFGNDYGYCAWPSSWLPEDLPNGCRNDADCKATDPRHPTKNTATYKCNAATTPPKCKLTQDDPYQQRVEAACNAHGGQLQNGECICNDKDYPLLNPLPACGALPTCQADPCTGKDHVKEVGGAILTGDCPKLEYQCICGDGYDRWNIAKQTCECKTDTYVTKDGVKYCVNSGGCENNCNNNGTCIYDETNSKPEDNSIKGKCDCSGDWLPPNCAKESKEDNCTNPETKEQCSGHGTCVRPTPKSELECQCDDNHDGKYCELEGLGDMCEIGRVAACKPQDPDYKQTDMPTGHTMCYIIGDGQNCPGTFNEIQVCSGDRTTCMMDGMPWGKHDDPKNPDDVHLSGVKYYKTATIEDCQKKCYQGGENQNWCGQAKIVGTSDDKYCANRIKNWPDGKPPSRGAPDKDAPTGCYMYADYGCRKSPNDPLNGADWHKWINLQCATGSDCAQETGCNADHADYKGSRATDTCGTDSGLNFMWLDNPKKPKPKYEACKQGSMCQLNTDKTFPLTTEDEITECSEHCTGKSLFATRKTHDGPKCWCVDDECGAYNDKDAMVYAQVGGNCDKIRDWKCSTDLREVDKCESVSGETGCAGRYQKVEQEVHPCKWDNNTCTANKDVSCLSGGKGMCAVEGGECECTGMAYYGKRYVTKDKPGSGQQIDDFDLFKKKAVHANSKGNIACTSDAFGDDPATGYYKMCWCDPSSA